YAASGSQLQRLHSPIIQLALSGKGMTEQTLSDLGMNFIRTQLITVPGAAVPWPYGGKTREVQIDLDPAALQARGLSGQDVSPPELWPPIASSTARRTASPRATGPG